MQSDEEARRFVAEQLLREAQAQEAGALDRVGSGLEAFEAYAARAHHPNWKDSALGAAYTFWDSWVDARNHEWHHYPRMREAAAWPALARRVAAALSSGNDPTELIEEHIG